MHVCVCLCVRVLVRVFVCSCRVFSDSLPACSLSMGNAFRPFRLLCTKLFHLAAVVLLLLFAGVVFFVFALSSSNLSAALANWKTGEFRKPCRTLCTHTHTHHTRTARTHKYTDTHTRIRARTRTRTRTKETSYNESHKKNNRRGITWHGALKLVSETPSERNHVAPA